MKIWTRSVCGIFTVLALASAGAQSTEPPFSPAETCPTVAVSVDRFGVVTWGAERLSGHVALEKKLIEADGKVPKPCLRIFLTPEGLAKLFPVMSVIKKHRLETRFVLGSRPNQSPTGAE